MHALLTRIVVGLLVLRAIAAPVAMRPRPGDPHQRHVATLRVCSWPPQRLQRFSVSSKLLQLLPGRNRIVPESETRPSVARGRLASLVRLARSSRAAWRGPGPDASSGRLRC